LILLEEMLKQKIKFDRKMDQQKTAEKIGSKNFGNYFP
jgi:hypothetical protein